MVENAAREDHVETLLGKGEAHEVALDKGDVFAVGEIFDKQSSRRGDVIREKLDGADGVIYFTGAKYAWHPII